MFFVNFFFQFSLLFLLIFCCNSDPFHAGNLGHRLSGGEGEYYNQYPENSIISLKNSLQKKVNKGKSLQRSRYYHYMEFDVMETYDNEIVIFHDFTMERVCPININRELVNELLNDEKVILRHGKKLKKYSDLKIFKLTLEEIKKFKLERGGNQRIPTLDELLNAIEKYKPEKPIAVEIKRVLSNKARKKLVFKIAQFRDEYLIFKRLRYTKKFDFHFRKIGFIITPDYFKSYFLENGSLETFCDLLKKFGFADLYGTSNGHQIGKCGSD